MFYCVIKEGRGIHCGLISKIIQGGCSAASMMKWYIIHSCGLSQGKGSKFHYYTFLIDFHDFKMNFMHRKKGNELYLKKKPKLLILDKYIKSI